VQTIAAKRAHAEAAAADIQHTCAEQANALRTQQPELIRALQHEDACQGVAEAAAQLDSAVDAALSATAAAAGAAASRSSSTNGGAAEMQRRKQQAALRLYVEGLNAYLAAEAGSVALLRRRMELARGEAAHQAQLVSQYTALGMEIMARGATADRDRAAANLAEDEASLAQLLSAAAGAAATLRRVTAAPARTGDCELQAALLCKTKALLTALGLEEDWSPPAVTGGATVSPNGFSSGGHLPPPLLSPEPNSFDHFGATPALCAPLVQAFQHLPQQPEQRAAVAQPAPAATATAAVLSPERARSAAATAATRVRGGVVVPDTSRESGTVLSTKLNWARAPPVKPAAASVRAIQLEELQGRLIEQNLQSSAVQSQLLDRVRTADMQETNGINSPGSAEGRRFSKVTPVGDDVSHTHADTFTVIRMLPGCVCYLAHAV
jgi:hypothetical protein